MTSPILSQNPRISMAGPPGGFLIYDFFLNKLGNGGVDFSGYKGNALLIVNVASRCGFTPQYKHLQKLHEKLSGKNFSVLAFPCNDFFNQESASERVILEFCDGGYGVTFDMFEKVKVRGIDAHPLYKYLIAEFLPVIRPRGFKSTLFKSRVSGNIAFFFIVVMFS